MPMPVLRFIPVALALTLFGCGSIGSGGSNTQGQAAGGLPPPPVNGVAGQPPGGAIITEPLPPAGGTTAVAGTPGATAVPTQPPATSGAVGRTDLLGGWTIASSGESCQLFMTLTSWTGGYRASTRGCNSPSLKGISAWNLQGSQVILAGQGGSVLARLQPSSASRFDGTTDGGAPVAFYR